MKVYIVTSGEYSDYHIECVFSTIEKAKKYIDTHSNDTVNIEEYELDTYKKPDSKFFNVNIFENDGKIKDSYFSEACKECNKEDSFSTTTDFSWHYDRHWHFYIACDSGKKAVKIARERLMQIKAQPYLYKFMYDKHMNTYGCLSDLHTYDYYTHEEL